MVFVRASLGCKECRSQHTRCDGASPSCGRCLRRGISCPGYRHVGGFVFKDETDKVSQNRNPRRRQDALESSQLSSLKSREVTGFIAFFFDTYIIDGPINGASCGLFDHTTTLCRRAPPTSTLIQAASVLGATSFVTSRPLQGCDYSWYHELRMNAVSSLHRDIRCRTSRLRDDTLMAVLLLDLSEAVIRQYVGDKAPFSHHNGALTLLKLRGAKNFETEEASSLYNAARYATLRGNNKCEERSASLQALDLLAKQNEAEQPPALRLLDVLDEICKLQGAMEEAAAQHRALSLFYLQIARMQMSLDAWKRDLPPYWRPRTLMIQHGLHTGSPRLVEEYDSMDIAVVYNNWRCACLKLMRLRQIFVHTTLPLPQPATGIDEAEPIFERIRQAAPAFLGSLYGPGFVEPDDETGAWRAANNGDIEPEPGMQRFPGDFRGKWFLADLLARLEQTIACDSHLLPALHVSPKTIMFIREQRQILSDLSYQPHPKQLERLFAGVQNL